MKLTLCILFLDFVASIPTALLAAQPGYYSLGHGDIRVTYEDGALRLHYNLDYNALVNGVEAGEFETGDVAFPLNELTTLIADNPITLPPDLPQFSFLGAAPDAPLWFIPEGGFEAEAMSLPWLGFSTEELDVDDWFGPAVGDFENYGVLQLTLLDVSGPDGGEFSMFYSPPDELTAPLIHFATSDGIDANDSFKGANGGLSTSTHTHVNWFFTAPGFYDVTLKVSGTHVVDGYKEAIGTVRFAVAVPEPGGMPLLALALVALIGFAFRKGHSSSLQRVDLRAVLR